MTQELAPELAPSGLIDPAVARRIAHDLRGATGIVAGALREIEAGSDVGPFVTMARRATARLERVARSLDVLGAVSAAPRAERELVDVDLVVGEALERMQLELRPGLKVEHQKGGGKVHVDREAFVAGVDEVLAAFGKRGKGIAVAGGVVTGKGFDHVPASAKPFEDPLGAARLLLERSGATLVMELEGDALKARVLPTGV